MRWILSKRYVAQYRMGHLDKAIDKYKEEIKKNCLLSDMRCVSPEDLIKESKEFNAPITRVRIGDETLYFLLHK